MRINKILMGGGIMVLLSEIVWYFSKKLYSRMNCKRDVCELKRDVCELKRDVCELKRDVADISEVMFFAKESKNCRVHASGDLNCDRANCPVRYMRKLESYINQAGRSLDVCIYMLTCRSLVKAMVNAHKRGVSVRVISDAHTAENHSSDVASFHSNGISVRLERIDAMMHHKFVIVDREIIITGSMNWTMSAFFGNWENLIISNQSWLVAPFIDEFDRFWHSSLNPPEDLPASTDDSL